MGPSFPFTFRRSWYDEHWYSNRPATSPLGVHVLAARLAALVALVFAGGRGLGH